MFKVSRHPKSIKYFYTILEVEKVELNSGVKNIDMCNSVFFPELNSGVKNIDMYPF